MTATTPRFGSSLPFLRTSLLALIVGCGPAPFDEFEETEPQVEVESEVGAGLPAPTLAEPVPGDQKVALSWSGGATDASYQLRFRVAGGDWRYRSVGRVRAYEVLELINGTRYDFQVRIKGSSMATTSSYSAARSATPTAPTQPPADTRLSAPLLNDPVAGDGRVSLSWSGGAADVAYQLRFREAGGDWRYRSVGRVTSYEVLELVNGTRYDFQVRIKGSSAATTSSYSAARSATPSGAAVPQLPSDACEGTSVRHITVTGAGSRDGTTEANAGTLANLNAFISAVGPGGTVCVHAGTYATGNSVTQGGSASAPVTIKGVGGRPVIASTFDASTLAKTGPTSFEVRASNLVFQNFEFRHVGSCFRFRAGVSVSNITLRDFRAENLATCVDTDRNSDAAVAGLTIKNAMILQFTRGAIFLTSNTSNVLMEDLYIDMQPDALGGRGSDYPVGIALYDETRDVILRRGTVMNVVGKMDGYTQGDGIDGETSAKDILVEQSYFRGSQDGCIDTKAQNMLIRDTVAAECKRNYRVWQYISPGPRVENVASYQPTNAHFFIKGGDTTAVDITVHSDNAASLVAYDCTSTTPCNFNVDGIDGTLLDSSRLNAATVTGNSLEYGKAVSIPPVPNTTSFTP